MSDKRTARVITSKEDIEKFINMTEEECFRKSIIMDLFGTFKGKSKYNPYDIITIPPGVYGPEGNKNTNSFNTTIGLWIFNRGFIEKDFFDLFGYINETINKKNLGKINKKLSYALLEDKITLEQLKYYIKKCQKFMPFVSILSPAYSMKMLLVTKVINKRKAELMKKYEKEIAAADEQTIVKIQDELMDLAMKELKDDPSMDMYLSGARGSLGNQFKNIFLMKGLCKDPDPLKGYNVIMSNQIDGVSQDEYAKLANTLAEGPYARAKKTEVGGYWEKLFLSAYQCLVLGPKDSDCGTKRTITVSLNKDNINLYMYSYIVEGSRLVELNSENMDYYTGKTVKMRFSSLCEHKGGFCNKCAGNLYYRIGVQNIGVTTPQLMSKLKNLFMKKFHATQATFYEMDPMKAFDMR